MEKESAITANIRGGDHPNIPGLFQSIGFSHRNEVFPETIVLLLHHTKNRKPPFMSRKWMTSDTENADEAPYLMYQRGLRGTTSYF